MGYLDFLNFDVELTLVLPIAVIMVMLWFFLSALKLPKDYYKNMQIREMMLKKRAEKIEFERIEARMQANMEADIGEFLDSAE